MAKSAQAPQPRQPVPRAPEFHLVVIQPFGAHRKGEMITDADEVVDVLAGPNKHHVNRIRAS